MQSGSGGPPAGWYPDPTQPRSQRYWDGTTWTQHMAPGHPGMVPMGMPPLGAPPLGAPPTGMPPRPTGMPPLGAPPLGAPPLGAPPTGMPPLGAPPKRGLSKGARWGIGIGIGAFVLVVVAIVIAVASFSGKVVSLVTAPADTVNEYFAAVKAGDYKKAQSYLCEPGESDGDMELDFISMAKDGDKLEKYYVHSAQTRNNRAWALFDYETTDGEGTGGAYLERRGGKLRICDITASPPQDITDDSSGSSGGGF